MALNHTLSLFIPDVEICALDAISPGLIATLTLSVAVFFTHTTLHELILHTVGSEQTGAPFEDVSLFAGSAVVREGAVGAFLGTPVEDL